LCSTEVDAGRSCRSSTDRDHGTINEPILATWDCRQQRRTGIDFSDTKPSANGASSQRRSSENFDHNTVTRSGLECFTDQNGTG
jgi:hypothetical protein